MHPERRWRVSPGRPSQRPHGNWLGLTSGHLCSFVSLMHTETTSFHVSGEPFSGETTERARLPVRVTVPVVIKVCPNSV